MLEPGVVLGGGLGLQIGIEGAARAHHKALASPVHLY